MFIFVGPSILAIASISQFVSLFADITYTNVDIWLIGVARFKGFIDFSIFIMLWRAYDQLDRLGEEALAVALLRDMKTFLVVTASLMVILGYWANDWLYGQFYKLPVEQIIIEVSEDDADVDNDGDEE